MGNTAEALDLNLDPAPRPVAPKPRKIMNCDMLAHLGNRERVAKRLGIPLDVSDEERATMSGLQLDEARREIKQALEEAIDAEIPRARARLLQLSSKQLLATFVDAARSGLFWSEAPNDFPDATPKGAPRDLMAFLGVRPSVGIRLPHSIVGAAREQAIDEEIQAATSRLLKLTPTELLSAFLTFQRSNPIRARLLEYTANVGPDWRDATP